MHALRKALGDEGSSPEYIETVRGIGYRFIIPVSVESEAEKGSTSYRPSNAERSPKPKLRVLRAPAGIVAVAAVVIAIAAALAWWLIPGEATGGTTFSGRSIAVLPFRNLSASPASAYLVEGIQETIITRLATIDHLRVISNSSSKRYGSQPKELSAIARQLHADDFLEGSVQKSGEKVLINIRLIDALSNRSLWAATYMRKLKDILAVEMDVATKVATALLHRPQPDELAQLQRFTTRDPDAYLLYLKGNYYARRAFGRANAKDPGARYPGPRPSIVTP